LAIIIPHSSLEQKAIRFSRVVCITSPLRSRCSIRGFSYSSTLAANIFGNFIGRLLAFSTPTWLIYGLYKRRELGQAYQMNHTLISVTEVQWDIRYWGSMRSFDSLSSDQRRYWGCFNSFNSLFVW
jgi:hypothetical protein